MAFDEWQAEDIYSVFDIRTPWFDGYQGEERVIIDECGQGMMDINFLKRLLDRYPVMVPIKGGSTAWRAKSIILTSNLPIEEWYPCARKEDIDALKRRLQIFEFPSETWIAKSWCRGGTIKRGREAIEIENDDEVITLHEAETTWT